MKRAMLMVVLSALWVSTPAATVRLEAELGKPLLLADRVQTTHLKVGLSGLAEGAVRQRTPVNVAIVLDKSGSMSGGKIRQAKEAARLAVDRLSADDIVSVVAYDDQVEVLVPATKVSESAPILAAIDRLRAGGSTALFAGVSKGAKEVRKFQDPDRVNRVILLSDGLANVGPSSPAELGSLGASLGREGIAVTTVGLGLGYNEDLMTRLAGNSDGNHAFAENASDLVRIFDQELDDVLSVVAQEVDVTITCAPGVKPLRVLGRPAEIHGQTVRTTLNQLYDRQQKYLLIEVEVPATPADRSRDVAQVDVAYADTLTRGKERVSGAVVAHFTPSKARVDQAINVPVVKEAVKQIAVERSKEAVLLRDKGRKEEARKLLEGNAAYLRQEAKKLQAPELDSLGAQNESAASKLDAGEWAKQRKSLRRDQYRLETQQSY